MVSWAALEESVFSGVVIDIYDAVKPVEIVTLYAVMFFVFNPNYGVCTMNYELQKAIRWLLRRGPTSSHSEQRS